MVVGGCGCLWMVAGGCEWLWVVVDGCGWLWMVAYLSVAHRLISKGMYVVLFDIFNECLI